MVARLQDGVQVYTQAFKRGLALDEKYRVNEFADKHRMLSSEGSAEPGPYRTDRVPFAKEIMECLSNDHPCNTVVWMKPTHIGATDVGINFWMCTAVGAAAPFAFVEPVAKMGRRLARKRLNPAIRDTPIINRLIAPASEKDGGNTTFMKEYPGGSLNVLCPISTDFQMDSYRYGVLDEIDTWEIDIKDEGDPIAMFMNRTANYGSRKKVFIISSPKQRDASLIEREYLKSDQRKYHVPCPDCGKRHILLFKGLKFEHEKHAVVGPVEYLCDGCGTLIQEYQKTDMLEQGVWVAENQENGKFPGFWINALYAPLGWVSWLELANEFLEAKRLNSEPLLRTFVNTKCTETWQERGYDVDKTGLYGRREAYGDVIPSDIVVITAGADVHDDRIEVTVLGHAPDEETYVLEHTVIRCNTSKILEVESRLDGFIEKTYTSRWGKMRISCVIIDAGYKTNEVYEYCKPRESKRVYAGMGVGKGNVTAPIAGDPKRQKNKTLLFMLGTHAAKDTIFARLEIEEPGPGYIHLPLSVGRRYLLELTAEVKKSKKINGFVVYFYKQIRDDNHALDCFVYALAALYIFASELKPGFSVVQALMAWKDELEGGGVEKKKPKRGIY